MAKKVDNTEKLRELAMRQADLEEQLRQVQGEQLTLKKLDRVGHL